MTDKKPEKKQEKPRQGDLSGQFLIAMPNMPDPRFEKSVVFICVHTDEGAMGLIINSQFENLRFKEILPDIGIEKTINSRDMDVQYGGPVEPERGFLLHSSDYTSKTSILLDDNLALTASLDILEELAKGKGPKKCLLTLGYAGWDKGQLDKEMQNNGWLTMKADKEIIFDVNMKNKWKKSLDKMGIDPNMLVLDAGHA